MGAGLSLIAVSRAARARRTARSSRCSPLDGSPLPSGAALYLSLPFAGGNSRSGFRHSRMSIVFSAECNHAFTWQAAGFFHSHKVVGQPAVSDASSVEATFTDGAVAGRRGRWADAGVRRTGEPTRHAERMLESACRLSARTI